jgi:lipopolysaccharide export system permease protein
VIVAVLSLVVRPWAYQKLHELSTRAESTLDVNAMQAGTFYVSKHGDRVIFFSRQDGPGSPARDVFVQLWHGDQVQIIHAGLGYSLAQKAPDGSSRIYLRDAHMYEVGLENGKDDQILNAHDIVMNPDDRNTDGTGYSSVAASSVRLVGSGSAPDIAELQWRLSTPLSTLLLGMLGIPMSRARPQQSKYTKLGAAILIYFGYYMLFTSARTWVQHGTIAGLPGIWWVPALLSLFLVVALTGTNRNAEFGRA